MASTYEIADFLRQLSLLAKAQMPLPETLTNLAGAASDPAVGAALRRLGEETAKGRSLSDAMRERPDLFPPFFTKMVSVGERNGTLPEVLSELAATARVNYQLSALLRDIAFYPLFTISLALGVLIIMSYLVLPPFRTIFSELLEGVALPWLTAFVFGCQAFICNHIVPIAALYGIFLVAVVWLLLDKVSSNKIFLRLLRYIPLSEMIFYNAAMARVCGVWGVLMKNRVPDAEALRCVADIADLPELSAAFAKAAAACSKGVKVSAAIEAEKDISRLLSMTISHTPEEALPEELEMLSRLFKERSFHGFKRVGAAWEILTVCAMAFIVGAALFFLFWPVVVKTFMS